MAKSKTPMTRNPKQLADNIAAAERILVQPKSGKLEWKRLQVSKIKTQPEMFQPRRRRANGIDPKHVDKLVKGIAIRDELGPPLIIKLGKDWICVDGHHRLEAYKKHGKGQTKYIDCHWFPGNVREAYDEATRRNTEAKLDLARTDKQEAAWERVVNGWGSIAEISHTTMASKRQVSNMRAALAEHKSDTDHGRQMRAQLGQDIRKCTWEQVRNARYNITPTEQGARHRGAKYARRLRSTFQNKLADDPSATAWALYEYDDTLAQHLLTELGTVLESVRKEEQLPANNHQRDVTEMERGELLGELEDLQAVRSEAQDRKAEADKTQATAQARITQIEAELRSRPPELPLVPSADGKTAEEWLAELNRADGS